VKFLLLLVLGVGCAFYVRFLWAMCQELQRLKRPQEAGKGKADRRNRERHHFHRSHVAVLHNFSGLRVRVRPFALRRTP